MKKWRFKRYLSLILVLVLLVNMYPIQSLVSVSSGDACWYVTVSFSASNLPKK